MSEMQNMMKGHGGFGGGTSAGAGPVAGPGPSTTRVSSFTDEVTTSGLTNHSQRISRALVGSKFW